MIVAKIACDDELFLPIRRGNFKSCVKRLYYIGLNLCGGACSGDDDELLLGEPVAVHFDTAMLFWQSVLVCCERCTVSGG